ncbi:MAG: hypothetical protein QOD12_2670, partial [Verrucomicrobiota bacterium]
DERLAREGVDRFAPPAVLDREQTPLLEIERGGIRCRQVGLGDADSAEEEHARNQKRKENARFQVVRSLSASMTCNNDGLLTKARRNERQSNLAQPRFYRSESATKSPTFGSAAIARSKIICGSSTG